MSIPFRVPSTIPSLSFHCHLCHLYLFSYLVLSRLHPVFSASFSPHPILPFLLKISISHFHPRISLFHIFLPLLIFLPDLPFGYSSHCPHSILQLIALLREVKYLEQAQNEVIETIPDSATCVYERNETFHKYCANLDLTVAWYNNIRQTLLEVEFPLVKEQLKEIDEQLEQAEKTLTWNGDGLYFLFKSSLQYCRRPSDNLLHKPKPSLSVTNYCHLSQIRITNRKPLVNPNHLSQITSRKS